MDIRGAPAFKARPLRDFNFRVEALPFAARADQHELATAGDELLEINKEHTTHLASGWVAARRAGASAYLWFPLDRCRDIVLRYQHKQGLKSECVPLVSRMPNLVQC